MHHGLVTNCFRHQLDAGELLVDLIAEAERRGYRAIELRQGSLGEFETGEQIPDAEKLTELPSRFPGIRFNIAIECPFFSIGTEMHAAVFSAGKWAAQAVAGEAPPHLRLVDLTTTDEQLADADRYTVVGIWINYLAAMVEIDGFLSVENGPQGFAALQEIFQWAREMAERNAHRLMLCYDPCNLLMNEKNADPATVTSQLAAADISLFHFKQRCDGAILPTVCEGDLDWPAHIALLLQKNYAGPGLFEVASSANVWAELEASRNFLRQAGIEWAE